MCGGGGGNDNSAEEARLREEARQDRINRGAAELQRVFGELYGNEYRPISPVVQMPQDDFDTLMGRALEDITFDPQASRRPRVSLSDDMLAELADLGFHTGTFAGGYQVREPQDAEEVEDVRQRYTRQLQDNLRLQYESRRSNQLHNFNLVEGARDPIWEQYRKAYLDSANTQLQEQMLDAGQQVSRSLGRGQRGSSVQQNRSDDLYKQEQLAQLSVNQNAEQAAVQRQAQVSDAYNSALATLNSTAHQGQALDQARRELGTLSNLNTTPVLGQLFNTAAVTGAAGYSGYQQGQQAARYDRIVNSPVAGNATVRW